METKHCTCELVLLFFYLFVVHAIFALFINGMFTFVKREWPRFKMRIHNRLRSRREKEFEAFREHLVKLYRNDNSIDEQVRFLSGRLDVVESNQKYFRGK